MKYIFLLLFSAIISLSFIQPKEHPQFEVYFHKVMIVDSIGNVMTTNWKIGASAKNYTYITSKDTENVSLTVDSITHFYLFYDPKDLYKMILIDLPFDARQPDKRYNVNYEYNLYVQLPKKCDEKLHAYLIFTRNEPFITTWDPFALTKCTINPCNCKICFWGNTNTAEKKARTYRHLAPEKY